jgi:hypothetical protein
MDIAPLLDEDPEGTAGWLDSFQSIFRVDGP